MLSAGLPTVDVSAVICIALLSKPPATSASTYARPAPRPSPFHTDRMICAKNARLSSADPRGPTPGRPGWVQPMASVPQRTASGWEGRRSRRAPRQQEHDGPAEKYRVGPRGSKGLRRAWWSGFRRGTRRVYVVATSPPRADVRRASPATDRTEAGNPRRRRRSRPSPRRIRGRSWPTHRSGALPSSRPEHRVRPIPPPRPRRPRVGTPWSG